MRFAARLQRSRALRTRAEIQCPVGALSWALDATSCALLQLAGTRDAKRRAFPKRKQDKDFSRKSLPRLMVETRGFEPPTSRVRFHSSGSQATERPSGGTLDVESKAVRVCRLFRRGCPIPCLLKHGCKLRRPFFVATEHCQASERPFSEVTPDRRVVGFQKQSCDLARRLADRRGELIDSLTGDTRDARGLGPNGCRWRRGLLSPRCRRTFSMGIRPSAAWRAQERSMVATNSGLVLRPMLSQSWFSTETKASPAA